MLSYAYSYHSTKGVEGDAVLSVATRWHHSVGHQLYIVYRVVVLSTTSSRIYGIHATTSG